MEAPNSSCPLLSKLIPPNQHSVAFTSTFSFLYSVIRCSFASLLSKSKAQEQFSTNYSHAFCVAVSDAVLRC